jgi:hypothetical protein
MLTGYDCTGFAPFEFFSPVKNGWRVGDPQRETIVCAGGAGYNKPRSTGELVVLRTALDSAKQDLDAVYVHGSGPIKITTAPMGHEVVTSAQRHGKIQFTSVNGVTGTLHLSDDTVTLDR